MSDLLNLCGLWRNRTQDGREYWSGNLGNVRLLVYPNTRKTAENQPDFNVCIAPKRERQQSADGPPAHQSPNQYQQPQPAASPPPQQNAGGYAPPPGDYPPDDDIPF